MKLLGKLIMAVVLTIVLLSTGTANVYAEHDFRTGRDLDYDRIQNYNTNNGPNEYTYQQELDRMGLEHGQAVVEEEYKNKERLLRHRWRQEEAVTDAQAKEARRSFNIFRDSTYSYYLDLPTARWVRYPYKANEYMLDVWIVLIANKDVEAMDKDGIAGVNRYFLEHYYIDPVNKQVQFLCELEISNGRPANDVIQRKYKPVNWENLVPGSVEDSVYHGVIRNVKKYNLASKNGRDSDDTWNMILDRFHIITNSVAEAAGIYI